MRLLAAHSVRRRIRQVAIELAEIRENEVFDLTGPLRLMQPVEGGVLRAIEDRAEDAKHARMWDEAQPMIGFEPAIKALEPK
jgi:hypothetical protein